MEREGGGHRASIRRTVDHLLLRQLDQAMACQKPLGLDVGSSRELSARATATLAHWLVDRPQRHPVNRLGLAQRGIEGRLLGREARIDTTAPKASKLLLGPVGVLVQPERGGRVGKSGLADRRAIGHEVAMANGTLFGLIAPPVRAGPLVKAVVVGRREKQQREGQHVRCRRVERTVVAGVAETCSSATLRARTRARARDRGQTTLCRKHKCGALYTLASA